MIEPIDPFEFLGVANPNKNKQETSGEKKKRVRLTPKQREYVWEHPKKYGRTCSICGQKITKLSDLELDHTRPYSKGGVAMNLAHRDCNRMKGSKNLKHIQKKMTFKTTDKTDVKKKMTFKTTDKTDVKKKTTTKKKKTKKSSKSLEDLLNDLI